MVTASTWSIEMRYVVLNSRELSFKKHEAHWGA